MQKLTLWPNQTFNSQKKEKYIIQLTFQLWPHAFIIVKVDSFMTNISSQSRFQIMSDAIMDTNYFPEMIKNYSQLNWLLTLVNREDDNMLEKLVIIFALLIIDVLKSNNGYSQYPHSHTGISKLTSQSKLNYLCKYSEC